MLPDSRGLGGRRLSESQSHLHRGPGPEPAPPLRTTLAQRSPTRGHAGSRWQRPGARSRAAGLPPSTPPGGSGPGEVALAAEARSCWGRGAGGALPGAGRPYLWGISNAGAKRPPERGPPAARPAKNSAGPSPRDLSRAPRSPRGRQGPACRLRGRDAPGSGASGARRQGSRRQGAPRRPRATAPRVPLWIQSPGEPSASDKITISARPDGAILSGRDLQNGIF